MVLAESGAGQAGTYYPHLPGLGSTPMTPSAVWECGSDRSALGLAPDLLTFPPQACSTVNTQYLFTGLLLTDVLSQKAQSDLRDGCPHTVYQVDKLSPASSDQQPYLSSLLGARSGIEPRTDP